MSARRAVEGRDSQERGSQAQNAPNASHDVSQEATGLTASQLLTPQQLAERLQIPTAHVYRLTRKGEIPAVRLGKYYRYRLDEIERWELEGGTDA